MMEKWKIGRMEEWNDGKMEDWKSARMEEFTTETRRTRRWKEMPTGNCRLASFSALCSLRSALCNTNFKIHKQ